MALRIHPLFREATMDRSDDRPVHAVHVENYAELDRYGQAFAKGCFNLLILYGAPGLGKSRCFLQAVGPKACWIDGNATAFGIYLAAHAYRNKAIVLDDVDGLYKDRGGIRLLKALCQSELRKTLCWQTDAPTLHQRGIPRKFTTTSRVAVIANEWKPANVNTAALEDRGHLLFFNPPPLEVHLQAAAWFWDQEIFDFVGEHLHLIKQHSLRMYILAWELKRAEFDWRKTILGRCLTGTALEVAKLKADLSYQNEKDRVHAFIMSGGGCRATYFNHAKRLQATTNLPMVRLKRSAPPHEMTR
jgi:hypothetical protein